MTIASPELLPALGREGWHATGEYGDEGRTGCRASSGPRRHAAGTGPVAGDNHYHTSLRAGADVAFARQVVPGCLSLNFTGNVTASLNADPNRQEDSAIPVLGGQAAVAPVVRPDTIAPAWSLGPPGDHRYAIGQIALAQPELIQAKKFAAVMPTAMRATGIS